MYTYGGFMKDFENSLDDIRIKLYEETKELDIEDIIKSVNSHAQKIAKEFCTKIEAAASEKHFQTINSEAT